jgi:hypothetical protein
MFSLYQLLLSLADKQLGFGKVLTKTSTTTHNSLFGKHYILNNTTPNGHQILQILGAKP